MGAPKIKYFERSSQSFSTILTDANGTQTYVLPKKLLDYMIAPNSGLEKNQDGLLAVKKNTNWQIYKFTSFLSLPNIGEKEKIYFVKENNIKKIYIWENDQYVEKTFVSDIIYDFYASKSSINTSIYSNTIKNIIIIEDESDFDNESIYIYNGFLNNIITKILILKDRSFLQNGDFNYLKGKFVIIDQDSINLNNESSMLYISESQEVYMIPMYKYSNSIGGFPNVFPFNLT